MVAYRNVLNNANGGFNYSGPTYTFWSGETYPGPYYNILFYTGTGGINNATNWYCLTGS